MRLTTTGVALWLAAFSAGACSRPADRSNAATRAERAPATAALTTAGAATGAAARPSPDPAAENTTADSARHVTIPAGTHLPIVLDTPVGSDISRIEQPVTAHLARAVIVRGEAVLPSGARVTGRVTDARRSGRVKGRAHVAIRFDSLAPRSGGEWYPIRASVVGRTAPTTRKNDALKIGAPAAGGALIGALVGGTKGALIGGAAGGGAGTAVVLSTRGKEGI